MNDEVKSVRECEEDMRDRKHIPSGDFGDDGAVVEAEGPFFCSATKRRKNFEQSWEEETNGICEGVKELELRYLGFEKMKHKFKGPYLLVQQYYPNRPT